MPVPSFHHLFKFENVCSELRTFQHCSRVDVELLSKFLSNYCWIVELMSNCRNVCRIVDELSNWCRIVVGSNCANMLSNCWIFVEVCRIVQLSSIFCRIVWIVINFFYRIVEFMLNSCRIFELRSSCCRNFVELLLNCCRNPVDVELCR